MDHLPRDIDQYIKQSIDHSFGLRVSSQTLEAKREVSMNAQALKKFVDENQRLAEALAEFGNDAGERAHEAKLCVIELERDLLLSKDELKKYKHHKELVKLLFDENNLLKKENKRLLRLYKERKHSTSGGKHTSSESTKTPDFAHEITVLSPAITVMTIRTATLSSAALKGLQPSRRRYLSAIAHY
ncbi:unnamed protein product [Lupinus luteus]|uniref:Uncharacterized protein n=1 Tax=Lupinus luteus TaxID=3873 RepID=A0AAV1Y0F7_LUPLU